MAIYYLNKVVPLVLANLAEQSGPYGLICAYACSNLGLRFYFTTKLMIRPGTKISFTIFPESFESTAS